MTPPVVNESAAKEGRETGKESTAHSYTRAYNGMTKPRSTFSEEIHQPRDTLSSIRYANALPGNRLLAQSV